LQALVCLYKLLEELTEERVVCLVTSTSHILLR
jgi:hypothetical protein